tara:strand:- start:3076 stop:3480 length:405 start_codon:yes stop_codon:yes gene_type:complete
MALVGILFNPMNMLAYKVSDLYVSLTLVYGGLLMASNMIWSHEIIHYMSMGHFNPSLFGIGIVLSIFITIVCLRKQLLVTDNQWLRRMISHHSTALTTSHIIYNRTNDATVKQLAKDIIDTQEKEIAQMKSMLT